ncbi:hypothetical protein QJS04_geneDACA019382 [Acorus gramineus]|uniref:Uncharacterized protein n=1 Tax=Acorus gramineus TaxID=55184 RepID=A0AAV9AT93_ACOGR|nr:hypothetical protein QJS04_geneDACA019382 [Acorus gramineus]
MENKKRFLLIAVGSTFSVLLFFLITLSSPDAALFSLLFPSLSPSPSSSSSFSSIFVESKLKISPPSPLLPPPPRFAYLISGSTGDGDMLKRALQALYHPINQYVVHLDLEAPPEERLRLRRYVEGQPVFQAVGNVRMITRANLVTYRGPTMVANTLHAAAILLRQGGDWDWFINLSASDYPLVRQDGSAWMALSRPFIDYCIWGWDNLPRTILMYYANFISSPEGYFHTVICNAQEFRNTTVNSDIHFISWDNPPKQHPHYLTLSDMAAMVDSNAPFARKFHPDDPVLDKVDAELLFRKPGMLVPGGWCAGQSINESDPCSVVGNTTFLRPGPGAVQLQRLMESLLSKENFRPRQCK